MKTTPYIQQTNSPLQALRNNNSFNIKKRKTLLDNISISKMNINQVSQKVDPKSL